MRALGVEVIEEGHDFQAASEAADRIAEERGWHRFPTFHPLLVCGVGTYALELFRAVPDIDTVYVPVGMGSGVCGVIAARDALGLRTRIVAVVSAGAPAFALSFERGEPVSHDVTTKLADGMACRTPNSSALAIARRGVERVIQVTDDEVKAAMRALLIRTTWRKAPAPRRSPPFVKDGESMRGRTVAIVLTGANVDSNVFARVTAAERQILALAAPEVCRRLRSLCQPRRGREYRSRELQALQLLSWELFRWRSGRASLKFLGMRV